MVDTFLSTAVSTSSIAQGPGSSRMNTLQKAQLKTSPAVPHTSYLNRSLPNAHRQFGEIIVWPTGQVRAGLLFAHSALRLNLNG